MTALWARRIEQARSNSPVPPLSRRFKDPRVRAAPQIRTDFVFAGGPPISSLLAPARRVAVIATRRGRLGTARSSEATQSAQFLESAKRMRPEGPLFIGI